MFLLPLEDEERGALCRRESLVTRARMSVGSREYRCLFIHRDYGHEDVINDGDLACAYFCSTPYHAFGLLKAVHTTVSGLEREILGSDDWMKIEQCEPGAVVFWETKVGNDGKAHRHVGICVGDDEAVHHDAVTKSPKLDAVASLRHHTGELRQVEAYYIHRALLKV